MVQQIAYLCALNIIIIIIKIHLHFTTNKLFTTQLVIKSIKE